MDLAQDTPTQLVSLTSPNKKLENSIMFPMILRSMIHAQYMYQRFYPWNNIISKRYQALFLFIKNISKVKKYRQWNLTSYGTIRILKLIDQLSLSSKFHHSSWGVWLVGCLSHSLTFSLLKSSFMFVCFT